MVGNIYMEHVAQPPIHTRMYVVVVSNARELGMGKCFEEMLTSMWFIESGGRSSPLEHIKRKTERERERKGNMNTERKIEVQALKYIRMCSQNQSSSAAKWEREKKQTNEKNHHPEHFQCWMCFEKMRIHSFVSVDISAPERPHLNYRTELYACVLMN